MKKHSQIARLNFAIAGLKAAWQREASLRTEAVVIAGIVAWMAYQHTSLMWWLVMLLAGAAVLSAELINTAIEAVCDAVHPDHHELIKVAKDCASAAVLIANVTAIIILAIYGTLQLAGSGLLADQVLPR